MNNARPRWQRFLVLVAALAATPAAGAAQQAALPEAGQLIARYVEAIGGRDAVLSRTNSRTTGTFEMPSVGLRGELEVLSARPNRLMTRVTIPGLGVVRSGFDGTVAWDMNPMVGSRVLAGAELDAMKDQAHYLAAVRDASLLRSRQTVERTEIGGQPCYRVELVWNTGRESSDCYHVESGLLVATTMKQESPMGSVEVTTVVSDYKDFGGIKTPTRMEQEMMGQKQVMTITSVEYDVVGEDAFALPAEIRALVGAGS
jgi:hypothetical protein